MNNMIDLVLNTQDMECNDDLNIANKILFRLIKTLNWVLQNDVSMVDYERLLSKFALIIDADRAYMLSRHEDNKVYYSKKYLWHNSKVNTITNSRKYYVDYYSVLQKIELDQCVICNTNDLNDIEKKFFERNKSKSFVILPVHGVENKIIGLVGFDDCFNVRKWGYTEINALKAVSVIIGTILVLSDSKEERKLSFMSAISELKEIREGIESISQEIT